MIESVLKQLQEQASEKYKKNVIKMGIPEQESIGVATSDVRKMAKKLPRDKAFVCELWQTNFHEARILAVLRMQPQEYSYKELTDFMEDVISWDLCDLFCKTVLIERQDYQLFIDEWIASENLYFKRAAFTLIASMSTHMALEAPAIQAYLHQIETYSDDERLLVKKAVSWALRELGKIDEEGQAYSIATAEKLLKGTKAQQWIAKDALKELQTLVRVEGRSRLISSKSKMGQAADQ